MSLNRLLPSVSAGKMSEEFHRVMVSHFPYIRDHHLYAEEAVEGIWGDVYQGDFHGLLQKLKTPASWEYLRAHTEFNGYKCSTDYMGEPLLVRVINEEFLNSIYQQHVTRRG